MKSITKRLLKPTAPPLRTCQERGKASEGDSALCRLTRELDVARLKLKQETTRRQTVEAALRKGERHYHQLLARSSAMQGQLRHLSHQILLAQEEERKKISRELHDEIVQTLTGINVHLLTLTREATCNSQGLTEKIARTQRLVEQSMEIVHRFARELRPALLDDLGLIPALHSYMKSFTQRTRLHIQFTALASVEELSSAKRTVLYRVVQAALTNVAQHANASQVSVTLEKLPGAILLEVHDNGKSFQAKRVLNSKRNKRLGLLGMRERVEMVGGRFGVESAPGQGTTIRAHIPLEHSSKN